VLPVLISWATMDRSPLAGAARYVPNPYRFERQRVLRLSPSTRKAAPRTPQLEPLPTALPDVLTLIETWTPGEPRPALPPFSALSLLARALALSRGDGEADAALRTAEGAAVFVRALWLW